MGGTGRRLGRQLRVVVPALLTALLLAAFTGTAALAQPSPYPPGPDASLMCVPQRAQPGHNVTCQVGRATPDTLLSVSVVGPAEGAPASVQTNRAGRATFRFKVSSTAEAGQEIVVSVNGLTATVEVWTPPGRSNAQVLGSLLDRPGNPPAHGRGADGAAMGAGIMTDSGEAPETLLAVLAGENAATPNAALLAALAAGLLGAGAVTLALRRRRAHVRA